MNVCIVTANAGDRNDYSDFYIPDGHRPPFSWWTMAEYLYSGYAEEVSIMGVYSTRDQAGYSLDEIAPLVPQVPKAEVAAIITRYDKETRL